MQLNSLPYGCNVTRVRGGVTYYYCGGIWYQPAYQGTTVVYIVNDIDAGANTDCRPSHLVQFAQLGTIYAKRILSWFIYRPQLRRTWSRVASALPDTA